MKPADLDAVEAAALRDAPRCAACGALATRACVGCHSTWCGSHDGTAGAPPCRDGMARLREDVRLTLARALREAWAERDGADRARRDADSRASQLALAVNARDRVLDLAATALGWPPSPTPAEAIDAALATVAKIARLENDLRQSRESYPRAEVLRALDAAGVEGVGIVDRVRRLVSDRDASRAQCEALALCIEPVVDGATGDGGAR